MKSRYKKDLPGFKNRGRSPLDQEIMGNKRLITYLHQNPVHHGFASHPSGEPFSSYQIHSGSKKRLNWEEKKYYAGMEGIKLLWNFISRIKRLERISFINYKDRLVLKTCLV